MSELNYTRSCSSIGSALWEGLGAKAEREDKKKNVVLTEALENIVNMEWGEIPLSMDEIELMNTDRTAVSVIISNELDGQVKAYAKKHKVSFSRVVAVALLFELFPGE